MKVRRQISWIVILLLLTLGGITLAQNRSDSTNGGPATQGVGLIRNDPGAYAGYTLLSPLQSTSTFLIDMKGTVVKTWETDSTPASIAYLLESGNLMRAGLAANAPFAACRRRVARSAGSRRTWRPCFSSYRPMR